MKIVDFYFDYSSTNSYFAAFLLPELCRRHDARVNWLPTHSAALFRGTGFDVMAMTPRKAPKKPARALKPRMIGDRELAAINLTNPQREFTGKGGAGTGVTKLDLAVYYARVGDWLPWTCWSALAVGLFVGMIRRLRRSPLAA